MSKPNVNCAGNLMRIPWTATPDAVIEDLNCHLPELATKRQKKGQNWPVSILDVGIDGITPVQKLKMVA
jgi:hypothetical protein